MSKKKAGEADEAAVVSLQLVFPKCEQEYLALCAEKHGLSLNQMAVYFIIKGIHRFEDDLYVAKENKTKVDSQTWDELCKELGWEIDIP